MVIQSFLDKLARTEGVYNFNATTIIVRPECINVWKLKVGGGNFNNIANLLLFIDIKDI